ncbi:MAG: hypothetical protein M1281_00715 [Chloroflexi bacterium]|nr:hypothetical protein [Chloroflexota bacterium]
MALLFDYEIQEFDQFDPAADIAGLSAQHVVDVPPPFHLTGADLFLPSSKN